MKQEHVAWSEIHLDAMRGIAALVVAVGHGRGLFLPSFTSTAPSVEVVERGLPEPAMMQVATGELTMGHQAVIVFFVLSGYLVGGSVMKSIAADRWRWSDYLVKRLVRLWIVLIPAIFIGGLIDYFGFNFLAQGGSIYAAPSGQEYVRADHVARAGDIWTALGNIFFLQGIVVPTAGTNLALWSLTNEFWYYLMFPLFLLACRPQASGASRVTFGLSGLAIAALIGPYAAFLFLVWMLGALVARMPPRIPVRFAGLAVISGAAVFIVLFATLKRLGIPLHAGELILAILTAALIYAIKCQSGQARPSLYSRTARFFSSISYTLYLTHLPFLIFVCAIINSPWTRKPFSPASLTEFAFVMCLVVAWAWVLYLLFEAKTDRVRGIIGPAVTRLLGRNHDRSGQESS